jgi:hypothetical protein
MDPKRFDDLTRALASGISRRRLIAMIGGIVAGSALGGIWPSRAVLAVGPPCLGCTVPGAFICGTVIYPKSAFADCIDACRSNPRVCFCQSCSPACPPGQTDCNGICCPEGQVCNGTLGCGAPCPEGFSPCGTGCCAPDFVCVAGNCVSCGCPPVKPYCVGAPGQGCSWLPETSRQQVDGLLDVIGNLSTGIAIIVGEGELFLESLAAVLEGVEKIGHHELSDPPDPNFTVIAQPITPFLSTQPVTAAQAGGQRQADAINALLTNAEQAIGVGRALLTSIQRAWGAFNAGDAFWEAQQTQAARQYAKQLAGLLYVEPQLLSGVRDAFQVAGAQQPRLTTGDVAQFQAQVGRDGLPSQLVQSLTDLGFDRTALDQIRQEILGQDPSIVAGLGGGDVLSALTDPAVVKAFLGVAQAFSRFAGGSSFTRATTITYTGDTSGDFHDQVTLAATLLDTSSSTAVPVSGATLILALGSQSCTAATDSTGQGMCSITPTLNPGSWPATATFAGGAADMPSFAFADFRVTKEEASLTYTGDTLIANGRTAQLSAVLKEDGTTPIVGRTVTFTLGNGLGAQVCSGTTDASGTATCTISPVSQPLGPATLTAQFAGDAFYVSASVTANTLVFAYLAMGSFVVGDENASMGKPVTFWGAQWAQANPLSGGPAPASFKGFAASLSSTPPTCGGPWSTSPANSASPPNAVPSYMGVVVSSSITQSGSTITGNSPSVIVLQTKSGYAPDPGHPGTGTVVGVVCPTMHL